MQRLDKEKAGKNLAEILEKMHTNTDLSMLSEYRKIYKREISLFRRSWAAAWLFMYYDQKETPHLQNFQKPQKNDGGKKRVLEKKPSSSAAPAESENVLPEDESKRLFISIGKNRRLYPREVIALISSKTSAVREDIGSIRILDNYSFVQVRDTKADEIIEGLNGIRFRGRTLAVNFAKPKTGEGESEGNNPKQE
jgi:hypothetical protein